MKEGYSTNQTLKPTNLNHPTRNPPKRFLYKPRHFKHARLFTYHSSQSLR